jgi:hypothetical protein
VSLSEIAEEKNVYRRILKLNFTDFIGYTIAMDEIDSWFSHDNNGIQQNLTGVNFTGGYACPVTKMELLMYANDSVTLIPSNSTTITF